MISHEELNNLNVLGRVGIRPAALGPTRSRLVCYGFVRPFDGVSVANIPVTVNPMIRCMTPGQYLAARNLKKVGTTSAWWSFLHEVHSKHECVGHCHPRRIPNNGMGMKAHINKAVMPHPMDDLPSMDATLPIMMAAKMISMNLKLTTGWIASITKHGPFCNLG